MNENVFVGLLQMFSIFTFSAGLIVLTIMGIIFLVTSIADFILIKFFDYSEYDKLLDTDSKVFLSMWMLGAVIALVISSPILILL